jgi:hypothetical protein
MKQLMMASMQAPQEAVVLLLLLGRHPAVAGLAALLLVQLWLVLQQAGQARKALPSCRSSSSGSGSSSSSSKTSVPWCVPPADQRTRIQEQQQQQGVMGFSNSLTMRLVRWTLQ